MSRSGWVLLGAPSELFVHAVRVYHGREPAGQCVRNNEREVHCHSTAKCQQGLSSVTAVPISLGCPSSVRLQVGFYLIFCCRQLTVISAATGECLETGRIQSNEHEPASK